MRNLNIDISELFLPVTPKLTRQEKSDLNAELVQLKQWEKFNQLTGFTSDIADEVEDRICEIKIILKDYQLAKGKKRGEVFLMSFGEFTAAFSYAEGL